MQRNTLLANLTVFTVALISRLRFSSHHGFLGTFADDFFYYLKCAENIAAGHGSTFDGTTFTNGYHPLWMACLVVAALILPAGKSILVAVSVAIAAGTAVTFHLSRLIASRLLHGSRLTAVVVAAYSALYYYKVSFGGMEVVLTVPLAMLLVYVGLRLGSETRGPDRSPVLGILAAATILSRIDSALFVCAWVTCALLALRSTPARRVKWAGGFALGLLPVAAYFAFNLSVYGGMLPVSGAAKHLKTSPWYDVRFPSLETGGPVFDAVLFYPALALFVGALASMAVRGSAIELRERLQVAPALVFPLAFYPAQALVSDWPLWNWYLYPLVVVTPVAAAIVTRPFSPLAARLDAALDAASPAWARAGSAALIVITLLVQQRRTYEDTPMYAFAKRLASFANEHPGRYAMGDRAGMVGYLMTQPLVQLEGLVNSRDFLQNIRQSRPLFDVLNELKVDYYASASADRRARCFAVYEPQKAGPSSPKMHGEVCQEPLFEVPTSDGTVNRVFAVGSVALSSNR